MAEKRSIPAREALADIRVGMTDDQLMVKYRLTDKGLQSLKNKLLAAGLVAQAQFDKSPSIQAPQENDTKVLARKIAEAVKAGWSDEEIAKTFGLLPDKLANVFPLLIKHGYLTQEDYDRRHSGLEDVIDIELDVESAPANVNAPVDCSPFAVIRGRTLLASLLLAPILAFTVSGIIWAVWEIKRSRRWELLCPRSSFKSSCSFAWLTCCISSKLSPAALLGHPRGLATLGRFHAGRVSCHWIWPLQETISCTCRCPISLPDSSSGASLDMSPNDCLDYWLRGCVLLNLLNFIVIVLMAPVVEEFFFRGLLLTRWSVKWNVRTRHFCVLAGFCPWHPDNFVGAFFLGYVFLILYIRTKSLFVPISMHMANNGIAWILTGVNTIFGRALRSETLAEWQSFWWVGLLAGLIVAPWVIWFTKRHFPKT